MKKKFDPDLKKVIDDCQAVASGVKNNREPTNEAIVTLANHLAKVADSLNWLVNKTGNAPDQWPDDMRP